MTADAFLVLSCFVLGLVFGSFANVVIHRVPAGESIVRPSSACRGCGGRVRPRDNVPVLSWLLLRGRCRDCGERISAQYPAVELTSAVLFAAMAARFGFDWVLPAYLLFAWTLLAVSVIDARTRRIPNRLTYPLTPALLVLVTAAALVSGTPGVALRALAGGVAAFGALFVLAIVVPRGMGFGDVKLAAFLGIGLGYLGWGEVLLGVFGGFLLGGVVAILLLLARLRGRKDLLPFGPYLAASAVLTVLWGQGLLEAYLGLFGIS